MLKCICPSTERSGVAGVLDEWVSEGMHPSDPFRHPVPCLQKLWKDV